MYYSLLHTVFFNGSPKVFLYFPPRYTEIKVLLYWIPQTSSVLRLQVVYYTIHNKRSVEVQCSTQGTTAYNYIISNPSTRLRAFIS